MLHPGLEPSYKSAAVARDQGSASGSGRSQNSSPHLPLTSHLPSCLSPLAARASAGEHFALGSHRLLTQSAAQLWQLQGGEGDTEEAVGSPTSHLLSAGSVTTQQSLGPTIYLLTLLGWSPPLGEVPSQK